MDAPPVGSIGRTLTPVSQTGQVTVHGKVYLAETSIQGADSERPPIAFDCDVTVSGWRVDAKYDSIVLLVRPFDKSQAGASAAQKPIFAAKMLAISRLSSHLEDGKMASFSLGLGQVVAVFACLITVFAALIQLFAVLPRPLESIVTVVGGVLAFYLYVAAYFVFKRTRHLARITRDQDSMNRMMWAAIRDLQSQQLNTPTRAG